LLQRLKGKKRGRRVTAVLSQEKEDLGGSWWIFKKLQHNGRMGDEKKGEEETTKIAL